MDEKQPQNNNSATEGKTEPSITQANLDVLQTAEHNSKHAETNKNSKWRTWLKRFVLSASLAFSIAAIVMLVMLYQQLQQQQNQLTIAITQQQRLNTSLAQAKEENAILQQQQSSINQAIAPLLTLPEQQAELTSQVSALAQRDPQHWKMAETQYLINLAGRKLFLEHDPLTSITLLQDADKRVATINDPALLALRQSLAKDIAWVKSIKQADIAGIVLTLNQIINKVDLLPLNSPQIAPQAEPDKELSSSVNDWRSNLAKTWQALLSDFIVVRHRTTDVTPLLSPKQQWNLTENIRNKLLQAQLALYRYNQANFHQDIETAHKWIRQYYDLNSTAVNNTLKTLDDMMNQSLPEIPSANFQSSSLVRQLIQRNSNKPNAEEVK